MPHIPPISAARCPYVSQPFFLNPATHPSRYALLPFVTESTHQDALRANTHPPLPVALLKSAPCASFDTPYTEKKAQPFSARIAHVPVALGCTWVRCLSSLVAGLLHHPVHPHSKPSHPTARRHRRAPPRTRPLSSEPRRVQTLRSLGPLRVAHRQGARLLRIRHLSQTFPNSAQSPTHRNTSTPHSTHFYPEFSTIANPHPLRTTGKTVHSSPSFSLHLPTAPLFISLPCFGLSHPTIPSLSSASIITSLSSTHK